MLDGKHRTCSDEEAKQGPSRTPRQRLLAHAGLLTSCLLLAYVPLLWSQAIHLQSLPHYQFFPALLLGAFWLAWSRGREKGDRSGSSLSIGLSLLTLAWL